MDRKSYIRGRRLQHLLALFTSFLLIFLAFDGIVCAIAEKALYKEIDGRLSEAARAVGEKPDGFVEDFINGGAIGYDGCENKMFLLLRNGEGAILNAASPSSFGDLPSLGFSPSDCGKIRTQAAARGSEKRYYRIFTMPVRTASGQVYYIQTAADSTGIRSSLNILLAALLHGSAAALILLLAAEWYHGKALTRGVTEAWEKQDEFISYASHEIRSPLTVIHNSLELLLKNPGGKIIDHSDLIINSLTETNRLRKMSANFLAMARLQASDLEPKWQKFDLDELILSFIDPFQCQAELAGKELRVRLGYGGQIVADRQMITELAVILLENALKYTEPGDRIEISTRKAGEKVLLSVGDTGAGVSESAMEKIFTRYYREERQQGKKDGSGLGLYIASLIVRRHRGKIYAEHNKPKGTVFTAVFPAKGSGGSSQK